MRLKTLVATSITLIGIGTGGAALAQSSPATLGAYLGAGAGQSDYDIDSDNWGLGLSTDDDTDTAWRVFGGVRPAQYFGAELGYFDFGEATGSLGASAEVRGVDLVGIGFLPLFKQGPNQLDAFGKIGGYWWDADVNGTSIGSDLDGGDDIDYTFGAGLQYNFNQLGVRAEWQRYNDVFGSVDTDVMMGSVLFAF